jgi:pyridoxamine 5'-phosphate oxidase
LFQSWFELALNSNCHEPTAMSVSTVSSEGRPSSRMVLLKQHDERGFRFATHYESRKAEEVGQTGHASLLFYWGPLNRQIRIEGSVERAPACESDEIFARRPRGARLGAWASPQSQPLADRSALLDHAAQLGRDYPGDVPRPPHWGAFILRPDYFEFWEGRDDRLHTRLAYRKQSTGWNRGLLAP